ncbi:MAG TPA: hypothetical protein VF314_15440, partial [Actinomycetes bacterium]
PAAMSGTWSRLGAGAALLALWLGTGTAAGNSWGSPGEWWGASGESPGPSNSLDLVATALTGPDSQNITDDAYGLTRSGDPEPTVDSTASSSADCDGCTADSTLVHVVYLDRSAQATLDNVSAAWSTCRDCRATAIAVQVIVLRAPQSVRANNRALAVNADCERCHAAAAAFQLVVASDRWDRLSRAELDELRRWAAEQAAALQGDPSGAAASPVRDQDRTQAALDQLEALVSEELDGSVTVDRDVDVEIATPNPAMPTPGPVAGQAGMPVTVA